MLYRLAAVAASAASFRRRLPDGAEQGFAPIRPRKPQRQPASRPSAHAASIFPTSLTRSRKWDGLESTLACFGAEESGLSATAAKPVMNMILMSGSPGARGLGGVHCRPPCIDFGPRCWTICRINLVWNMPNVVEGEKQAVDF
jgi:hypothetical protein